MQLHFILDLKENKQCIIANMMNQKAKERYAGNALKIMKRYSCEGFFSQEGGMIGTHTLASCVYQVLVMAHTSINIAPTVAEKL